MLDFIYISIHCEEKNHKNTSTEEKISFKYFFLYSLHLHTQPKKNVWKLILKQTIELILYSEEGLGKYFSYCEFFNFSFEVLGKV